MVKLLLRELPVGTAEETDAKPARTTVILLKTTMMDDSDIGEKEWE
jgi:hypothetical protein